MEKFFEGLIFKWEDGRTYHLEISGDDVSPYILSAGSPRRIELLEDLLDNARLHVPRRGLTWILGYYKDIPVFGFTSGMGPSSMGITLTEVMYTVSEKFGYGYIIRVGTSGALQNFIKPLSIIVADSAVRDEATSSKVIFPEFPANMDPVIYLSLLKAAIDKGYEYGENLFLGKVQSKDDLYFYEGFHNSPIGEGFRRRFGAMRDMGVLASEMEASILPIYRDYFIWRYRREKRVIQLYVGAILATLMSPMNMDELEDVERGLLSIALEGLLYINRFREGEFSLDDILRLL